jgi:hypothetical protein
MLFADYARGTDAVLARALQLATGASNEVTRMQTEGRP